MRTRAHDWAHHKGAVDDAGLDELGECLHHVRLPTTMTKVLAQQPPVHPVDICIYAPEINSDCTSG